MKPPDNEFREKLRRERLFFVKKSAEWVRSVPNEVWSQKQRDFIDSQFDNRESYALTKEQYLHMIESARSASNRRKGAPDMPDFLT